MWNRKLSSIMYTLGGDFMNLLIVEDNRKINDLLAVFSRQDRHNVTQTFSAEEALNVLSLKSYDVILTDLMLPKMQGEEFVKKIRSISDIYIIVITAKIEINEKLDLLSLGADDYITKPFSVEEVMLKLKNVDKRLLATLPLIHSYEKGLLKIMSLNREVYVQSKIVNLTKYEYDLLWYLATNRNRIFNRDQLIEICFSDSEAFDRVIDAYIKNIRRKLQDDANNPKYIKTHYGIGYEFVGELDD